MISVHIQKNISNKVFLSENTCNKIAEEIKNNLGLQIRTKDLIYYTTLPFYWQKYKWVNDAYTRGVGIVMSDDNNSSRHPKGMVLSEISDVHSNFSEWEAKKTEFLIEDNFSCKFILTETRNIEIRLETVSNQTIEFTLFTELREDWQDDATTVDEKPLVFKKHNETIIPIKQKDDFKEIIFEKIIKEELYEKGSNEYRYTYKKIKRVNHSGHYDHIKNILYHFEALKDEQGRMYLLAKDEDFGQVDIIDQEYKSLEELYAAHPSAIDVAITFEPYQKTYDGGDGYRRHGKFYGGYW